ncbi:MAG: hypothetical protein HRU82_11230 [Nitrospira sp.]|nr:MAG: hypothetical protein HRU82_11230 [Nitrospira sp.]
MRRFCALRAHWLLALSALSFTAGCSQAPSMQGRSQEDLGRGILSGTLGIYRHSVEPAPAPQVSRVLVGQVQVLEGGAYLVRDQRGYEHRIPHDENTRIDRPAHVGDRIQGWLDRQGRAILIKTVNEPER